MQIECYAQRLLNPFRGVVQVIRYASAEAVTTDGVEWDIYVANDALLEGLGRAGRRAQISDIRYGHWSAQTGLKRGPLYPSDDFKRLEEMGAVVYEHLLAVHRDVPFKFRDRFELWLLDRADRPLALLHSVCNASETDTRPPLDWRAGMAATASFRSTAVAESTESAAACLTRAVNGLASGVAQWFRRSDDGAALGLHTLRGGEPLRGRVLDADAFPALFLATREMDPTQAQLVDDYHAWQAPWLLLLADLDDATRHALEARACEQGELLEKHCRLYPRVIDRPALQAARVAAALARTTPPSSRRDEIFSLDYLELGLSARE
ncbi:hypothetical protein Tbd_0053 [Thiobacillus denitrificans ATCC 25259]|uniref:Uncharacterized protein n=1 Tax=Thiobacillus denitrificans (strain ATCC 25259 / T1) TaxID=292415 RepID=Q3SMN7_THIDA|nr:hypothetical protein [Thiobacillus denitrificans]AAZ96006.1 hypothetical protein Tbd_0053 [Thiobacillus denitrificans ATCC 25259]